MNEKKAREVVKERGPYNQMSVPLFHAEGYLEGLAQGREEGEARIIEKAKGLEEAIEKMTNEYPGMCPASHNPEKCHNCIARKALSKFKEER